MKDSEKLLILLYEASQEKDERFPSEQIKEIWDEKVKAKLFEELNDNGFVNTTVIWGIGGDPIVNIGYPWLTYKGEKVVKELVKPWWQKIKMRSIISYALAGILLTAFINLDKIESNYHKYISNGKLVSFVVVHIKLR